MGLIVVCFFEESGIENFMFVVGVGVVLILVFGYFRGLCVLCSL